MRCHRLGAVGNLANMAQLPHTAVQLCSPSWCGECISRTGKNESPISDVLSQCFQVFPKPACKTPLSNHILCVLCRLLAAVASLNLNVIMIGTSRCKIQQNIAAVLLTWSVCSVSWNLMFFLHHLCPRLLL